MCRSKKCGWLPPDKSFGNGGYIHAPTALDSLSSDEAYAIDGSSDGSLFLVGQSYNKGSYWGTILKLKPDGTWDSSFDGDGLRLLAEASSCNWVKALSTGKLLLGCSIFSGMNGMIVIIKLNSDGSLDTSFGTNGTSTIDFNASADSISDGIVLDSGRIVFTGNTVNGTWEQGLVFQLNADGSLDTTFASSGVSQQSMLSSAWDLPMVLLSDDSILYAADLAPGVDYFEVGKLTSSGTIDSGFGSSGVFSFDASGIAKDSWITDMYLSGSGTVFPSGAAHDSHWYERFGIVAMDPSGALLPTFGTNGVSLADVGLRADESYELTQTPDGKLIQVGGIDLAATDTYGAYVKVLLPNGEPDPNFGVNGSVILDDPAKNETFFSVEVMSDGHIVAAGTYGNNSIVARLNSDGTLDTSFGTNGETIGLINQGHDLNTDSIVLLGTKIYTSGLAFFLEGSDLVIARYSENGFLGQ